MQEHRESSTAQKSRGTTPIQKYGGFLCLLKNKDILSRKINQSIKCHDPFILMVCQTSTIISVYTVSPVTSIVGYIGDNM